MVQKWLLTNAFSWAGATRQGSRRPFGTGDEPMDSSDHAIHDPSQRFNMEIAIQNEKLICIGISCAAEPPGITSAALRDIPVARLMRRSANGILKFDFETLEDGSLA